MRFANKFLFLSSFILLSLGIDATQELNGINTQNEIVENTRRPNPSLYASDAAWDKVYDYLMPDDHPIKKDLDDIFLASRALESHAAMKAAGFSPAKPQKYTELIFTRHPKLKGYVIKAYLDSQKYHNDKAEFHYWARRALGANIIQKYIDENNYGHLLSVPKKWIYLLPDEPSPNPKYIRKNFILVEEDMNIYDDAGNKRMWKGPRVTKELLNAIYKISTDLGLHDSLHPLNNCPFSKDGRVAFVDTQRFYEESVKFFNITPYLSPKMRSYWLKLTKHREILTTHNKFKKFK